MTSSCIPPPESSAIRASDVTVSRCDQVIETPTVDHLVVRFPDPWLKGVGVMEGWYGIVVPGTTMNPAVACPVSVVSSPGPGVAFAQDRR